MHQTPYRVEAFWDRQAQVWVAESEDVPGLATETNTIEALTDKLKQMIPELLLANDLVFHDYAGSITEGNGKPIP